MGPSFAHRDWVLAVAFSPNGSLVATVSKDGTARLWDRATGLPVGPALRHEEDALLKLNMVLAVAFSPDGKTLATGGLDGKVRFWDVPRPLEGSAERVLLWVKVATGETLDADGAVRALNAAKWQECRRRLEELGGPP